MATMKTTNGGLSWGFQRVLTYDNGGACLDIAVAPTHSNIVYAVGYSGESDYYNYDPRVFRSSDGSSKWINVTNNLTALSGNSTQAFTNNKANAICIAATGPNQVIVGTDMGAFTSDDAGATWNGSNLSKWVNDLIHDPGADIYYAATNGSGVYRSVNGGAKWTAFNNGLDIMGCLCLDIDTTNGYLYVGTNGGSVWQLKLTKNAAEAVWRRYR